MAAAFFDVDGTLFRRRSMVSFYDHYVKNHPHLSARDKQARLDDFYRFAKVNSALGRQYLNRWYYTLLSGETEQDLWQAGRDWFDTLVASDWIGEGVFLLERRRNAGDKIVLVSGASDFILAPIKDLFRCTDMITSTLRFDRGKATGDLCLGPMVGTTKLMHVQQWLTSRNVSPAQCHAFGDHFSDAAMMAHVGHPVAVCPDDQLRALAEERGWRVVETDESANSNSNKTQMKFTEGSAIC